MTTSAETPTAAATLKSRPLLGIDGLDEVVLESAELPGSAEVKA